MYKVEIRHNFRENHLALRHEQGHHFICREKIKRRSTEYRVF